MSAMLIIGLTGYAGSGKDEFAKALIAARRFRRFALADGVREAALALDPNVQVDDNERRFARLSVAVPDYGWETLKRQSADVRQLLQKLGTDVVRKFAGPDAWVNLLDAKLAETDAEMVVITDVRFPNEVDWLLDSGGYLVRIDRPGVGPANAHASESFIESFEPHYVVDNSSDLEQLYDAAVAIADEVIANAER